MATAEEHRPVAGEWIVAPGELAAASASATVRGLDEPAGSVQLTVPAGKGATLRDVRPETEDPARRAPERSPGMDGLLSRALARLRIDPGQRGVLAVAAVAVVAATVAGVLAWRGRPEPVPLSASTAVPAASAPSAEVVVAVSGAVRRPGLVRLQTGARVADAVAAAGGVLPGTPFGSLNLARKLVDGELIVVGTPAEGALPGGPPGAASGPAAGTRLSLNAATAVQLDALPGIGPVLAQRILDFRTARGGFRSVEQLREVDGLGETRYQRLKDLVTV